MLKNGLKSEFLKLQKATGCKRLLQELADKSSWEIVLIFDDSTFNEPTQKFNATYYFRKIRIKENCDLNEC